MALICAHEDVSESQEGVEEGLGVVDGLRVVATKWDFLRSLTMGKAVKIIFFSLRHFY